MFFEAHHPRFDDAADWWEMLWAGASLFADFGDADQTIEQSTDVYKQAKVVMAYHAPGNETANEQSLL